MAAPSSISPGLGDLGDLSWLIGDADPWPMAQHSNSMLNGANVTPMQGYSFTQPQYAGYYPMPTYPFNPIPPAGAYYGYGPMLPGFTVQQQNPKQ